LRSNGDEGRQPERHAGTEADEPLNPQILKEAAMADAPEWMKDLQRAVPDSVVRDLVSDFRSYNPHPTQDPSATVRPAGAGVVKDGDVGPQHRPYQSGGWQEPPKVDSWRPPGLREMDALMDQEDLNFRAQRVRELAEASAVQRALAEAERKEKESQK
jgi:hypothetical protein